MTAMLGPCVILVLVGFMAALFADSPSTVVFRLVVLLGAGVAIRYGAPVQGTPLEVVSGLLSFAIGHYLALEVMRRNLKPSST